MSWPVPLIAGFEDVIFPVVVIAIMIVVSLVRMAAKLREAQQGPPQQRPFAPHGQPGRAQMPGGPRPNVPPRQEAVRKEIDAFVRAAAERRGGAAPPGAPQARPAPAPADAGGPFAPARPRPAEKPVEAQLVEVVAVDTDLAQDARAHLDPGKFRRLASGLGQDVTRLDDMMEDHLHEAFDHRLTSLGPASEGAAQAAPETPSARGVALPPTAAAGLAAMFADPGSVRQAILVSEILQRPEQRWQ